MAAQANQISATFKEQAALKEALDISQAVIASLQQQSTETPPKPATEQADDDAPQTGAPATVTAADPETSTEGIAGKSFVITGTLKELTYEQVTQLITDAGGRLNKMPSGKTDYIVVGKNPGSKLKKAEKYNTPQLNEAELLDLLNQSS